jgi:hypothetical protein
VCPYLAQDAPLTAEETEALLRSLEASLEEELREEGARLPHTTLLVTSRADSSTRTTFPVLLSCASLCAEAAILAEYEASLAAEDAALAAAAAEYELWDESGAGGDGAPDGSGADAVRCPVCRVRRLLCVRGVVCCACGGLRLDLSAEGAGLAHVGRALAAAWEEHARSGCTAEPRFGQRADFGAAALWAHCAACDTLMAVL